ncbi:DUF1476 domain-containing protein [Roseospira goensis]|uniref:DUF1476 domain-containing protein n=1 Tax=Roseospira goensis TaxID=391922 RepID=A0A7W6RXD8_9PROT|nr:DUF1476 domain-containing protein [Roseospira goensis]MBB4284337.1 hypothetical protein [Roseospira goensis]
MSDPIRERERAFEAKYEHDEALRFRVLTRRNKLFGLWIAGETGLSGPDADAYAHDLIEYDLVHAGAAAPDLIAKAQSDLSRKGIEMSRHRLELRLAKLLHEAEAQVNAELVGKPVH